MKLRLGNKKINAIYQGKNFIYQVCNKGNRYYDYKKTVEKLNIYLITGRAGINSASFTYTFTGKYTNHFTSIYPATDWSPSTFSGTATGAEVTRTGNNWSYYYSGPYYLYYLGKGSVGATSLKVGLSVDSGSLTSCTPYFHSLSFSSYSEFPNSKAFSLVLSTSSKTQSFTVTTTEECLFLINETSFPTLGTNNAWVSVEFYADDYKMMDLYASSTRPYNIADNRFIVLPAGTHTFKFAGITVAGTPTDNTFSGTLYYVPTAKIKNSLSE